MLPNMLVLQRRLQRHSAAASLKAVAEALLSRLIHERLCSGVRRRSSCSAMQ
jgi:hypothetical protein